jgi:hypothetical protein
MATEEPAVKLLEKDGSFELRQYAAYVVAETRVEADFEDAGGVAFQSQFRYISGNIVAQQKIAMTAPVSQVADGRAFLVACRRYSGRWTLANYRESETLLRERIKARGLVARGEAVLARYNPPFTPWFLRRNEMLIPVAQFAKR